MKQYLLPIGMLTAAVLFMPFMAEAKPYQRFDTSAIYENTAYAPGQKVCVEKRTNRDGDKMPWVQFKVVGHNDFNVDKYGTCDTDAVMHRPQEQMLHQFQWEATQGRKLYSSTMNNRRYSYSPGSLICRDYKLMKVNVEGQLKGTGRDCAVVDYPTFDPR